MIKIKHRNKSTTSTLTLIKCKFLAYHLSFKLLGWITGVSFLLLGEWYSIHSFPLYSSVIVLCGSACIAFSSSLINNVFDKKLDIFAKKPIFLIFEYISTREMLFTAFLLVIAGLILLWYVNLSVFIIGLAIAVIGILYSTPPLRLKTSPPFDSIVNTLILGPLPFLLGWAVTGRQLTTTSMIYGIIFYLFINAYVIVYTSIDIKTDKKYGIETTCTKLGLNGSIAAALITFSVSLILSIFFFGLNSPFTISALLGSPFFFMIPIKKESKLNILSGTSIVIWIISLLIILSILAHSMITLGMLIIILLWFFSSLIIATKILPKKI